MTIANIYDAKTNLSKYIERALRGEDIVLARHGKPAVRLVPVPAPTKRLPGRFDHLGYHLPADFDATPPEISAALEDPIDAHTA